MKKNNFNQKFLGLLLGLVLTLLCVDVSAQASLAPEVDKRRQKLVAEQQQQLPGSAKWDAYQAAINHLQVVHTGILSNPSYLDENPTAYNLKSPMFRKLQPSIMNNYTAAQLATFNSKMSELDANGLSSSGAYQKLNMIMSVNTY